MMGQTDPRPLRTPCYAYYAGSAKNVSKLNSLLLAIVQLIYVPLFVEAQFNHHAVNKL